jgi:hypothetical protein
MANQGGDRGKAPNVTGTLPKKQTKSPAPARRSAKKGPKGPRKMRRGTTRRSRER